MKNVLNKNKNKALAILIIVGLVCAILVYKSENQNCKDDYVDWNVAVTALSEHFKELAKNNKDVDFGPADIRQHFKENCEEDLKIYNDYIKNKSPYSQQDMKKAIIYFNQSQDYEKALVLAKEYVSLYPEDQEGWVHRGYAYFGLGNCAEATSDLTHASMNGEKTADSFLPLVLNSEVCGRDATKTH